MSGVLAIADPANPSAAAETMARMVAGLRHRPWYVVETASRPDEAAALGRVGIGIYGRAPQPARTEDDAIEVVLTGKLFDTDALRRDLLPGTVPQEDAALLANLYAQRGAEIVTRLQGEFVAVVHDRRRQELVVLNDRFAFYPTYIARDRERFLVAPEAKAILAAPGFVKRLDLTALAQFIRFQVVLGDRTFFEGISLLPPATVCRCDLRTGSVTLTRYWEFGAFDLLPEPPLAEMAEECARLLSRAVNRVVHGPERAGLLLSGGLDSRLLLGLADSPAAPLRTFTFGSPGSRDVEYARRAAQRAGSVHRWFPLSGGSWVIDNLELDLALTEGSHSWIHMHGISTLPALREQVDVMLTGWDGGTVVGGWRNRLPLAFTDADDLGVLTAREFGRFNQLYTWPGIDEGEERALYADALRSQLVGRAFESLRDEMVPFLSLRPDLRAEMFYVRNHCFRLTMHTLTLLRSHVEVLSPFFDFELFRFLYSLPATARGYKMLLREILRRHAPRLALIPDARDDLLPTTQSRLRGAHWLLGRLAVQVNRRLAPVFPEYATLYADYEGYLRGDLRRWGEDVLLGPRLRERGLFDAAFLRSLWERVQSGEPDIIGKLASIMTYELILRRYWD